MTAPTSVAIYGGSFDPPHLGHVLSVAWALSDGRVDVVWIVPTWQHAFGKEHGASFEQRRTMCGLAFAPLQGVEVLDIEQRLGGVSRTVHTLEALRSERPGLAMRLLVGADVLPTTDRWHRWEDIVALAPPLVVGREGYPPSGDCPISIPNVSSTDVRARLDEGRDLHGLVPGAVLAHIEAEGLYAEDR